MISTFRYFDPLKGRLGQSPFYASAQNTLWRARSLIRNRSLDDVMAILRDADSLLDMYFDDERREAIREIENAGDHELIEYSDGGVFRDFKPEAFERYDIRDRDSVTDLNSLEEALSRYFDPTAVEADNVQEFEYFGCLALTQFEDFVRCRDYRYNLKSRDYEARPISTISDQEKLRMADILLEALDSVSRGEAAKVRLDVASRYEKKIEEIQTKKDQILQDKIEEIRKEVKAEMFNSESARRKEEAAARNDIRHEANRQIQEKVLGWYSKEYKSFPSAAKAAKAFCQRLEKDEIYREQRTLENWLRKYAKENGIRLTP